MSVINRFRLPVPVPQIPLQLINRFACDKQPQLIQRGLNGFRCELAGYALCFDPLAGQPADSKRGLLFVPAYLERGIGGQYRRVVARPHTGIFSLHIRADPCHSGSCFAAICGFYDKIVCFADCRMGDLYGKALSVCFVRKHFVHVCRAHIKHIWKRVFDKRKLFKGHGAFVFSGNPVDDSAAAIGASGRTAFAIEHFGFSKTNRVFAEISLLHVLAPAIMIGRCHVVANGVGQPFLQLLNVDIRKLNTNARAGIL